MKHFKITETKYVNIESIHNIKVTSVMVVEIPGEGYIEVEQYTNLYDQLLRERMKQDWFRFLKIATQAIKDKEPIKLAELQYGNEIHEETDT